MEFTLFGFDFLPSDDMYGFWICGIKDFEEYHRSFFCIYYNAGDWILELCYFRIFGDN